jgi:hypothetical protein
MNTEIKIPPTLLALPAELQENRGLLRWADFQVKTVTDQELAVGGMAEIKGRIKAIEHCEDQLFGPIKDHIKNFETWVREHHLKPLKITLDSLNVRVISFWNARQAKLEAEARAAREKKLAEERELARKASELAATTGNEEAINEMVQRNQNVEKLEAAPVEVSQTVRTTAGTLSQTRNWTWRVLDEAIVPRQYFVLDAKKLNAEARVRAKGEPATAIPGIEFYQETRTSLRV